MRDKQVGDNIVELPKDKLDFDNVSPHALLAPPNR